jgi:hypothetical protein
LIIDFKIFKRVIILIDFDKFSKLVCIKIKIIETTVIGFEGEWILDKRAILLHANYTDLIPEPPKPPKH